MKVNTNYVAGAFAASKITNFWKKYISLVTDKKKKRQSLKNIFDNWKYNIEIK